MFVFSLFTSNIIWGGTNRPTLHITPYNVMLHFVTVYTICYLLLSCGPETTIQGNSKIGTPFCTP